MPSQPSARKVVALLSLLCLMGISDDLSAQTKSRRSEVGIDPARSLLWVGNSYFHYNNGIHSHVVNLARAGDPEGKYSAFSVTISDSGIDWHDIASYLRPGGIGKYSFVGDDEIVFDKPGRRFDAVIMMDCSQCPIHPQLKRVFHEYVKKNAEIVERSGASPVLFMSWAYKDRPEMTAQLAEQYTIAGNANDALVIPAGLAFAKAIAKRPDIELYAKDKRHPSLAGTYLAACTAYAAILKKSLVGNKYDAGLSPELAGFLQAVAAETVQEYYGK